MQNPMNSIKYIVSASQAGAKLDSNVLTGGGTDDTVALQTVLDQAPKLGRLHLIMDGAALVRGLNVHSNTTIECPNPACGFFLADGANRAILRNANPTRGEIVDCNITIHGGIYNNNRRHQLHHTPDNQWVTAMDFFGIEQLTLRDIVIRDQRTFAVFVSNFKRVYMEHIDILLHDRQEAVNTDGLHFCGPGQFLTLRDIHGCTYDDFIALNADDAHSDFNERGELVNNGAFGPYASFGDLTDVLIDGVVLDEATQAIRFLSRASRIDRVIVRNVFGVYRTYGCFMDTYGSRGGNFGHIVFDTIDLRTLEAWITNDVDCHAFLFAIGGRHEALTFRNLHHHHPGDNRRLIWVKSDGKVGALTVDGLDITADRALDDPRYIIVDGQVDRLRLHNIQVTHPSDAPATGALLEIGEGQKPHGIKNLQLQDVNATQLGTLVRQLGGTIGRRDENNVIVTTEKE